MAEGNGKDPKPVDTLFGVETFDAGVLKGIGHVILHEARLADIWPFMGIGSASEFGLRMFAASIEINGKRLTYEEFGEIGVRHMRTLQALFPEVNRINGIGDEEDEPPKNVGSAETSSAPIGSVAETGS